MHISGSSLQNWTPYLISSSSSEEEKIQNTENCSDGVIQECEDLSLIPESPKEMPLKEAEKFLAEMQNGVVIPYLSMLNLQFVALSKILKELSCNREISSFKILVSLANGKIKPDVSGKSIV